MTTLLDHRHDPIRQICYDARMTIECISAITLATHDMSRAVRFYRTLGFEVIYGKALAPFGVLRRGVRVELAGHGVLVEGVDVRDVKDDSSPP